MQARWRASRQTPSSLRSAVSSPAQELLVPLTIPRCPRAYQSLPVPSGHPPRSRALSWLSPQLLFFCPIDVAGAVNSTLKDSSSGRSCLYPTVRLPARASQWLPGQSQWPLQWSHHSVFSPLCSVPPSTPPKKGPSVPRQGLAPSRSASGQPVVRGFLTSGRKDFTTRVQVVLRVCLLKLGQ